MECIHVVMQNLIDRLDEDRIREAVQRAEERTAGEIVPVVVPGSAEYEVVAVHALGRGADDPRVGVCGRASGNVRPAPPAARGGG
jgi:uncharacterized membrane protein